MSKRPTADTIKTAMRSATAGKVAKDLGISRRTLYRILDEGKLHRANVRKLEAVATGQETSEVANSEESQVGTNEVQFPPVVVDHLAGVPTPISRDEGINIIASRLTSGNWVPSDIELLADKWQIKERIVRDWFVAASAKCAIEIDPHALGALFADTVDHLRALACKQEAVGDLVGATKSLQASGTLIVGLIKGTKGAVILPEARGDAVTKLSDHELLAQLSEIKGPSPTEVN